MLPRMREFRIFCCRTDNTRKSFFEGRLATLLVEEAILLIFITRLCLPAILVKVAAQIVVIILNYAISKFFVFRK